MSGEQLVSVDYEVFGKVQGVFFRKYTQAEGKRLGVVGWVQNTEDGTVRGQLQGLTASIEQMQQWLRTSGSPKSRISKAEFSKLQHIHQLDFTDFRIVR